MGPATILPEAFPLSRPMVHHLAKVLGTPLEISMEEFSDLATFEDQVTYLRQRHQQVWQPVLGKISQLRSSACEKIQPVAQQKALKANQFGTILQQYYPPRERNYSPSVDISRWRSRGLIRGRKEEGERGILFESAIAVLMMRLALQGKEREFLPPGKHTQEPYMYVWRQDGPGQPVLPCGLPLSDVPNHSFLFTRWPFLGLHRSDWLPFEGGSVRWGGTYYDEESGETFWNMSEEELRIWEKDIPSSLRKDTPHIRHQLANLVLARLASRTLSAPTKNAARS